MLGLGHTALPASGTVTITPLHCLHLFSSPRVVFVQSIQTTLSVQGIGSAHSAPNRAALPSTSTAIHSSWSWASPQLLKALPQNFVPQKPDPASRKVFLVLESVFPTSEKQRL